MPRYRVRRATVRDLDVLVRHRRGMWEDIADHPPAELDRHDRIYRRWARQRMRTGKYVAWIAVDAKGTPAASGAVWLQEVQPHPLIPLGSMPYLLSMYTEPEHRGRGLATRLVREAMGWAKREGYVRMTLHASEQGRGVYRSLGWKRTWEMRVRTGGRKPPRRTRSSRTRSGRRQA